MKSPITNAQGVFRTMTASPPVFIIGAGPVGLCLSLALAKEGIASTVVEALKPENVLEQVPRAGTNHPSTLEMYDSIGLYEKLEPRGIKAPLFHYWDRKGWKRIAEFDHGVLKNDTRFPFALQCERIKIVEEGLKLAQANPLIDVRLATTFESFEQGADGVKAVVVNEAGERETVTCKYLVSAEGARSIVRKDLDIEFEGFTETERTLNIEVSYEFRDHGFTERNYISDPDEWSNLFHWKGPHDRWRVHFPTSPDQTEEEIKREENLHRLLRNFIEFNGSYIIRASNLYTVHQRVAKKFRRGRCILVGDSAHVNSPIGAMGLNSGVHDAFNLSAKLIAILRGEADENVLDRYERQRRHIALAHTQADTIRNKRRLAEQDPAVRQHNSDELRRTSEDPVTARRFLMRTALFDSLREADAIA
ncbi:MAG: FAD-dependent monooxygenase [Hyphomicrobiaceae bacterium]